MSAQLTGEGEKRSDLMDRALDRRPVFDYNDIKYRADRRLRRKEKDGPGKRPLSHYKSGLTKLRNGTAAKMSMKVLQKGIVSEFVGGLALDAYYGLRQSA